MARDHGAEKGEPARLAADRALPDANELERVAGLSRGVIRDDAFLAAQTRLRERLDQERADRLRAAKLGRLPLAQLLGHREEAARREPQREVVARGVVLDRRGWHRRELLFQLERMARAANLGAVRHPEDELSESECLVDELPDVAKQIGRLLRGVRGAERERFEVAARVGRLKEHRDLGVDCPHLAHELVASFGILLSTVGEAHVADDRRDAGAELAVKRDRLLVRAREQHLGARAHADETVQVVQPLGGKGLRLLHQLDVEQAEESGVVADGVLHHEDRAHTCLDVVNDVEAILDELDDRKEDGRAPRPPEHHVDRSRVEAAGELAQVRFREHEQHDR